MFVKVCFGISYHFSIVAKHILIIINQPSIIIISNLLEACELEWSNRTATLMTLVAVDKEEELG